MELKNILRPENCITHHHACDCREMAHIKEVEKLKAEVERLRSDLNCARQAKMMLMKAIPESVLPQISDEVKLACLITTEEYEEGLKEYNDGN